MQSYRRGRSFGQDSDAFFGPPSHEGDLGFGFNFGDGEEEESDFRSRPGSESHSSNGNSDHSSNGVHHESNSDDGGSSDDSGDNKSHSSESDNSDGNKDTQKSSTSTGPPSTTSSDSTSEVVRTSTSPTTTLNSQPSLPAQTSFPKSTPAPSSTPLTQQSDSITQSSSKFSSSMPTPNGSPVTLTSTVANSPLSSQAAVAGTNDGPNNHLAAILIPTILVVVSILAVLSFLFVRYRQRRDRLRTSAKLCAPIKSWNSISLPGFDKLLNKTSMAPRKSDSHPGNTDLETGAIRACPNPKMMDEQSRENSSISWNDNKRTPSSQFSIRTLPPDS